MDGHAAGQRAGWLLAATVLALGASVGVGDRSPSATSGPPPARVADIAATVRDAVVPDAAAGARPRTAIDSTARVDAPPSEPQAAPAAAQPAPPRPNPGVVAAKPVWWSRYRGVNHVWMPTLGMDRPVYGFACSRSSDPANLVYRWGCAGTNNVYLLGHAWGVFRAVHDAYDNGKLKVGMPVVYADSHGHVHLYRVTKWAVTSPTDISWSDSQRVPSMTLQTCLGARSQWRLNVRLVKASS